MVPDGDALRELDPGDGPVTVPQPISPAMNSGVRTVATRLMAKSSKCARRATIFAGRSQLGAPDLVNPVLNIMPATHSARPS